jgi:hypothetical protein
MSASKFARRCLNVPHFFVIANIVSAAACGACFCGARARIFDILGLFALKIGVGWVDGVVGGAAH